MCNSALVACLASCDPRDELCTREGVGVPASAIGLGMSLVQDWCCGAPCNMGGRHSPATSLVLIGGTGVGKSETANTILQRKAFSVSPRLRSETDQLQHTATVDGMYRVIDTPGWFGAGLSKEQVDEQLQGLASVSEHGIDAFLLTFTCGRFDDQDFRAFQLIQNTFGSTVTKHVIFVFTKCQPYYTEEEAVKDMIDLCRDEHKRPGSRMCNLLQELGGSTKAANRIVAFGELNEHRRNRDRERLLTAITYLKRSNGGARYDHAIFSATREARERMRLRIEELPYDAKELLRQVLEDVRQGNADDDHLEKMLAEKEEQARLNAEKTAEDAATLEKELAGLREEARRLSHYHHPHHPHGHSPGGGGGSGGGGGGSYGGGGDGGGAGFNVGGAVVGAAIGGAVGGPGGAAAGAVFGGAL